MSYTYLLTCTPFSLSNIVSTQHYILYSTDHGVLWNYRHLNFENRNFVSIQYCRKKCNEIYCAQKRTQGFLHGAGGATSARNRAELRPIKISTISSTTTSAGRWTARWLAYLQWTDQCYTVSCRWTAWRYTLVAVPRPCFKCAIASPSTYIQCQMMRNSSIDIVSEFIK